MGIPDDEKLDALAKTAAIEQIGNRIFIPSTDFRESFVQM